MDRKALRALIRENSLQLTIVLAIFLFMIIFGCGWATSNLQQYMANNAEETLRVADERMRAELRKSEAIMVSIGVTMMQNQIIREADPDITELQSYLASLNAAFRDSGDSAAENYNGYQDTFWYRPGDNGDIFVSGSGWDLSPGTPVDTLPWYQLGQEQPGRVIVTPPYWSPRSLGQVITAAILLAGDDGEEYGFLGIDIAPREIAGIVVDFLMDRGGYGYLIGPVSEADSRLCFIAYPETQYEGIPLETLGPQYVELERRLARGAKTVSSVRIKTIDNNEAVAFYQETINGWYAGLAFPTRYYYNDVYTMAIIYTITGLSMMLILCYFLLRLSLDKIHSDEENKAKSSFLAQVSHEIRTPLNSILGMSEIILRNDITPELSEKVSIIKQAGNILLSIINNILDFSKIETNKMRIYSSPYHLASMVNDVINIGRLRLMDKQVDFFVNIDSDIPAELIGDEIKIRQILINLLNNAIKYTKAGYIRLDIAKQDIPQSPSGENQVKIMFAVEDTGIGIRQDDLNSLFGEFTRLDLEHNHDIEGSGLGLTIANSFCRAMGGGITVTSNYGKGSVFTATVVQSLRNTDKIARLENLNKQVLIYEDRPAYLQSLLSAFSSLGLNPQCARDIAGFKQGIQENKFDYAFVSSRYAAECTSCLPDSGSPVKLLIMLNTNDMSGSQPAGGVHLPIYSCVLANILNGVTEAKTRIFSLDTVCFSAPTARILVVDDLPTNLRIVEELMRPYGMKVDTCLSGPEALDRIKRNLYDLVFMDHMMPEMDGLVVTDLIRKQDSGENPGHYFRDLPIVMLTANAVTGQREIFLKKGIDDFLSKPIDVGKLNSILEKWIPREKQKPKEEKPRQEVPAAETAESPAAEEFLPAIPGVDIRAGLQNAGSSAGSYISILSFFHNDLENRIPLIRKAVVEKDLDTYTTLVHAVKGAARSIGAVEAGDLAAELELAGRSRDSSIVGEKTEQLMVKLEELSGYIRRTLDELEEEKNGGQDSPPGYTEEADGDISGSEAEELKLEALRNALINMDTGGVNAVLSGISTGAKNRKIKRYVAALEQHILLFEYDKAIEMINKVLSPPPLR
jgi:signal transduction histidine kinase/CheY-like chemotaxis protein/HPt (histidine-containing phosphotransfer) domain-containing protein